MASDIQKGSVLLDSVAYVNISTLPITKYISLSWYFLFTPILNIIKWKWFVSQTLTDQK